MTILRRGIRPPLHSYSNTRADRPEKDGKGAGRCLTHGKSASATVVKKLGIGTDKGWQPAFPYQANTKGGILRSVFQAAYKDGASLSAENYGRWTTNSYCLAGDDRNAIAYSMPLILPDGTVYGVVGVELLTEYLKTKLPFKELDEDKAGTYFIVTTTDVQTDSALTLRKTVTSGEDLVTADAPLGVLNCRSDGNGGNWLELGGKRYYMVLEPLQLYNRNAPFAAEKWFLAGTMEQSVLLAFSDRVRKVLLATILVTLVLGVLGSLLVSARLARPINRLYREVIDAQEKKTFPHLSRTAIREVDRFAETITELNKALLPSGNALHISLSGGIAWYPDDGQDWETLKKYADFAMYQVKHAEKGRVQEFDIGVYNREAYAERTRREFRQLLSNAQVFYCFQPIFSARSGKVAAYEALMRSDLPTLRSPATIMKLAREQGALYEIERITFTKALETFDSLCRAGSVSGDAMLFVNSIASTCLTQADVDYIDSRWRELRRRMVIEITEEEEIDYEALERKRNAPGFSGMFALDDYGSGYSNENTLLQLAPRFVKVDITIIRGIDTSPDKQQILRNVAAYAHPRSMKIVAEGVETAAELRTVIELGADLLQGYFLARPAIVPGAIAPEAAAIIGKLQRRRKD